MGTPDFAVRSLEAVHQSEHEVIAVITAPDKAAGRGQKIRESAVKQYAVKQGISVLQPERLKSEAFLQALKELNADLQIVVAFRMLPEVVWNMPPLGTFNLHASLLPQYRGAAPINWAVINGEEKTGLTTFFLRHEIDTGDVLFREEMAIGPDETAGELHDRLMEAGGQLVAKTVDAIASDRYTTTAQSELIDPNQSPKEAPKIFKETCRIDWKRSMNDIHNHIRGLSPYPAAWTGLEQKTGQKETTIKIFHAYPESAVHAYDEPTLLSDGKSYLKVAVQGGHIHLSTIQLAGKKRMEVSEFLRGFPINEYLIK